MHICILSFIYKYIYINKHYLVHLFYCKEFFLITAVVLTADAAISLFLAFSLVKMLWKKKFC